MSLLAFMKYMTDHPDELKAYKQDPHAFFDKHQDIALTKEEQRAVQGYSGTFYGDEATTVFRLAITLGQGQAPNTTTALPMDDDICEAPPPPGAISLGGVRVNVYAHSEAHVFFTEPQVGTVSCITLRHSYLLIPDEQNIYFDLHLCCTDPDDETDRAQVLYITTAGKTQPTNAPMYEHKPVSLTIPPVSPDPERHGYILATAEGSQYFNNPIALQQNSWYDPDTHQLCLDFNSQQ
jgi:hypothetical protein